MTDEKFPLGEISATPGALEAIDQREIFDALLKHASGDWGNVTQEDKEANETSLRDGSRLLSVYFGKNGTKFWIITEADRSATTVLLPEEY